LQKKLKFGGKDKAPPVVASSQRPPSIIGLSASPDDEPSEAPRSGFMAELLKKRAEMKKGGGG
jgi:hypothetical protein